MIHPPYLPSHISTLHRKQCAQVDLVPDPHKVADQDTHSKCRCIACRPDPFLHPLFKEEIQSQMEFRISRAGKETNEEPGEDFWSVEVLGSIEICPILEDVAHPN